MIIIKRGPSRREARIIARIARNQNGIRFTTNEVLQQNFRVAIDENRKVVGAVNETFCFAVNGYVQQDIKKMMTEA